MDTTNKIYRQTVCESNFRQDYVSKIFLSESLFDEELVANNYKFQQLFDVSRLSQAHVQYSFPDTNVSLNESIQNFHVTEEGYENDSFSVCIGEGSTPLMSSVILLAKQMGFKKIYSLAPLYFTVHKMCDTLNIDILACNSDLTYTSLNQSEIHLPQEKSFLFITDPIWTIGRHHAISIFRCLSDWQKQTGSFIFVDGSFSYINWDTSKKWEIASTLDKNLTIRLISPTKTMCLHGIRFSYVLCPNNISEEFLRITISNIGSSCFFSYSLREQIFNLMIEPKVNYIASLSSKRFAILSQKLDKNQIEYITPECGFFVYVNLEKFLINKGIREKYAWLSKEALDIMNYKYNGYVKINLLSRSHTFNSLINDL